MELAIGCAITGVGKEEASPLVSVRSAPTCVSWHSTQAVIRSPSSEGPCAVGLCKAFLWLCGCPLMALLVNFEVAEVR